MTKSRAIFMPKYLKREAVCFYGISVSNLNGCLKGRQKTAGKDKNNKPLEWAYCG